MMSDHDRVRQDVRKKIADLDANIAYAKKQVRDPQWGWAWKEQLLRDRIMQSELRVKLARAEQEQLP